MKAPAPISHRLNLLLLILTILKLTLPWYLQNPIFEPHRDEFLYLSEGLHLAWGYLEIPPLLALFSWITVQLGGSFFLIKLFPVLFSGLSFFICGKLVIRLGGKYFALILIWLPFIFGAYIRVFFLFQPGFLEIFFWIAMAFSVVSYIQTEKNYWFYIFGISLGLGLLSKSTTAFYLISLLIGIAFTPFRKWFLNKHFYLSGMLALVIYSPNLIWEYFHHFPILHHMHQLQQEQLQYRNPLDFIANQFLMNLTGVFIWVGGIFYILNSKGKKFRLFIYSYGFFLLIMIFLNGKDYYALGLYPILFVFGSVYLEEITTKTWGFTRFLMIGFTCVTGLLILPLLIPIFRPEDLELYYKKVHLNQSGFLKWEDQKLHPLPQDFSDMLGWKTIASKTATVYKNLNPKDQKKTIIFCDDYCTAGLLTYYGPKFGLPEPYSDASNFILWLPDQITFTNILLVRRSGPKVEEPIHTGFENEILEDSLSNPLARENGMKMILLKNVRPEFLSYIYKVWSKKKEAFDR